MLRGKMTVPYKYTVKVKTQEERVLWALEDKAGTRANKPEGQYTYWYKDKSSNYQRSGSSLPKGVKIKRYQLVL